MSKSRIPGLRWWMITLIMLGAIVNYLTRATLSVAAPTLIKDLHIGPQEYSWINAAFQGAIMLQPFCGYALDVLGLKTGYAIFAVAWSFINMAHASPAVGRCSPFCADCWVWRRVRPTQRG
jgi:MFS transporter, ACS family, hexuronate transporter